MQTSTGKNHETNLKNNPSFIELFVLDTFNFWKRIHRSGRIETSW